VRPAISDGGERTGFHRLASSQGARNAYLRGAEARRAKFFVATFVHFSASPMDADADYESKRDEFCLALNMQKARSERGGRSGGSPSVPARRTTGS
jgi:hypothetical protein